MRTWSIGIADEDWEYAELLLRFLRHYEMSKKWSIVQFTGMRNVQDFLTDQSLDILLLSPQMVQQLDEIQFTGTIICLTEDRDEQYREDVHTAFRYQPLPQLAAQLVELHAAGREREKLMLPPRGKGTQVISVYSAFGGSGKTTISLSLARELAQSGSRVVYLSLELLFSVRELLEVSEARDDFSRLVYDLKANADQFLHRLHGFIKQHSKYKFDFLLPPNNFHEMLELEQEDVQRLIGGLRSSERFDYIIVDLESALHERIVEAMMQSDTIVWVLQDDYISLEKHKSLRQGNQNLNILQHPDICYVLNKYTGRLLNKWADTNMEICEYLPYVPEWKAIHSLEQMLASASFNRQIYALSSFLTGKREEVLE